MNRRNYQPYIKREWDHNEIIIFLKSWKKHNYLFRFMRHDRRKDPLYSKIVQDLKAHHYYRSMREVLNKILYMKKKFKNANKKSPGNGAAVFRYYNDVLDILASDTTETETSLLESIINMKDDPHEEDIAAENISLVKINIPDQEAISNSSPPSETVINQPELEMPNKHVNERSEAIQVNKYSTQSTNTPSATSDILLNFYKEFQRTNHQRKENDAAMLQLFKEQNDIFRTQTTLLVKLLQKD